MAKEKDEKDVTEVPYFAYGESGGEGGGEAEREGEGNFMEGGKEVRLSLAGRRPVNHHADHVYV